jgi:hypothetical protein
MGIIDVRRLRKLQLTETTTATGTKSVVGVEELLVVLDDSSTTFEDVATSLDTWAKIGGAIPRLGDLTAYSGSILNVTSRKFSYPDEDNDRLIALTINYESKELEDPENEEPKPPDSYLNMSLSSVVSTVPARGWYKRDLVPQSNEDEEGFPARNSAEDPVDGLTEELSMVKFSYTNTLAENPNFEALLSYANTCNDGTFLGGPDYTVKCNGYSAEYDPKTGLWSVSLEFLYNPKGWFIEYYDVGYNRKEGAFDRFAIVDKSGNPVTKPVALNDDGTEKAVGVAPDKLKLYPYKVAKFDDIFSDCNI